MSLPPFRGPHSILAHTLFLVLGIVAAMAAMSIALVLLRPPPVDTPVSTYEIARLFQGEPIAKSNYRVDVRIAAALPAGLDWRPPTDLVRRSLAAQLGRPASEVRLYRPQPVASTFSIPLRRGPASLEESVERQYRLYSADGYFIPNSFGAFTAALRLPDGRWRIVERTDRTPLARWQAGAILWIAFSVLLVIPIAWIFAKRIARPIRAFAAAADRVGRREAVEPIASTGPSEIGLAATALNDMQARIGRYVAERTSMMGAIAHDLRTPLTRLNFRLAAAPEPLRTRAAAEIAEMEQMIAMTMDFVQNEARASPRERIDLTLLVEGVVDDLADMGEPARLAESRPAVVVGDAVLLKRLFGNLVANAIRYGGSALVAVRADGGNALVDVLDDGPGLSPEDAARAFEPFYRAEGSRNRATGGMGLGLAIVRAAAQAHGGSVALDNRSDGGLRARVTLPLA